MIPPQGVFLPPVTEQKVCLGVEWTFDQLPRLLAQLLFEAVEPDLPHDGASTAAVHPCRPVRLRCEGLGCEPVGVHVHLLLVPVLRVIDDVVHEHIVLGLLSVSNISRHHVPGKVGVRLSKIRNITDIYLVSGSASPIPDRGVSYTVVITLGWSEQTVVILLLSPPRLNDLLHLLHCESEVLLNRECVSHTPATDEVLHVLVVVLGDDVTLLPGLGAVGLVVSKLLTAKTFYPLEPLLLSL